MSKERKKFLTEDFKSTCKNHPNTVCYVCGLYATSKYRRLISSSSAFRQAYESYFGFPISNQDKNYVPRVTCNRCYVMLNNWFTGKSVTGLNFVVPCRWREPRDHLLDCYFCNSNFKGLTNCNRKSWKGLKEEWPASVSKPVENCAEYPVPLSPAFHKFENNAQLDDNESMNDFDEKMEESSDDEYLPSTSTACKESRLKLISQEMLNDLARELRSTPIGDLEVLASRLQEWGFLEPKTKITALRNRQQQFAEIFKTEGNICYCADTKMLFRKFKVTYIPTEWRMFVDMGKDSLKAVLLKNGNDQPSVLLAYSRCGETYENLRKILELINYGTEDHNWLIVCDFKVLNMLRGLGGGYPKHPCIFCTWEGHAFKSHWDQKDENSPLRGEAVIGQLSVQATPLVPIENILLPPLHLKLGLVSQPLKVLGREHKTSSAFLRLKEIFKGEVTEAKLLGGVLTGPQIRKLREDNEFSNLLQDIPHAFECWEAFGLVVDNILGSANSTCKEDLIDFLLTSYQRFNCNMSLKVHMFHRHLDLFCSENAKNMGDMTEESGERFHKDISPFEERYKHVKDHRRMIGDYCNSLIRETDTESYKRKGNSKLYFKN